MRTVRAVASRWIHWLGSPAVLAVVAGAATTSCDRPGEPEARDPRGASERVPGLVVPSPENPAWLAYEGAGPAFFCGPGDDEGFFFHGSLRADGTRDGDQVDRIERLAATGANALYVMAIRSHGGDGGETENPFVDHDPDLGLNDAVLDQWAEWLRLLEEAGIVVYFFFYDDEVELWETGDRVGPEERAYLETLVDRFEERDNLVWVVAEEYQEIFTVERARAIARTIREADGRDRAVAIHQLHGLEFDFKEESVIDQFAIQYNVPTETELHAGVVAAFEDADGRYSLAMVEAEDHGTGATARRKNWAVALGGAYSLVFSWDTDSASPQDLRGCGHLVGFMESLPLARMEPRDDLAFGDTRYVLADPGRDYVAYAPDASGSLGLGDLPAGIYELRWFDPVTGRSIATAARELEAGDRSWGLPPEWDGEVALHLRRVDG